jgi:hypothetical protein
MHETMLSVASNGWVDDDDEFETILKEEAVA